MPRQNKQRRGVGLPAVELDDDLAVAVVVDLLELADVAWRGYMLVGMLRVIKHASSASPSEDV